MIDTNEMRKNINLCEYNDADLLALCDEIDRLRVKPKSQGKTVRVKVAVAVDRNGRWMASGAHDNKDQTSMDTCLDFVEEGEARYWLTADLPIPEETTVEATVKEG